MILSTSKRKKESYQGQLDPYLSIGDVWTKKNRMGEAT